MVRARDPFGSKNSCNLTCLIRPSWDLDIFCFFCFFTFIYLISGIKIQLGIIPIWNERYLLIIVIFSLCQFNSVPLILLKCVFQYMLIALVVDIHYDINFFIIIIGEYCQYSVTNIAAVIICSSETEDFSPIFIFQVWYIIAFDLQSQRHLENWPPAWYCGKFFILCYGKGFSFSYFMVSLYLLSKYFFHLYLYTSLPYFGVKLSCVFLVFASRNK